MERPISTVSSSAFRHRCWALGVCFRRPAKPLSRHLGQIAICYYIQISDDELMQGAGQTNRKPGPDFCCIGAQKAGTGWLYEQLRSHPDFWMPPMKELHYFDRPARSRQRSLTVPRKDNDRIAIARERARDDRDYDFLRRFEQLANQPSLNLE